jgi:hypothetical protein
MKEYTHNRRTTPITLSFVPDGGERPTSCPSHFTQEKEPQYPLNRILGGPHSQSGHFGEEKNNPKLQGKMSPNI